MVRRLLTCFNLAQRYVGILRRIMQHLHEEFLLHEVRAGAGSQIAAARQQLHRLEVDFLIAADSILHRAAGLRKGRRVEDDEVILVRMLVEQLAQQIKNVCLESVHNLVIAVDFGIMVGHLHSLLADVDSSNAGRTTLRRIERKGAGMREAVQHMLALGDFGNRLTVVLLVEEEAGLLAVLHINSIVNAVLHNFRRHSARIRQQLRLEPMLVLVQALQTADFYIVALEQTADFLSHLAQNFNQQLKNHLLAHLDAKGQSLRHQKVIEAVDRQAGEHVRLTKNQTAAFKILLAHNCQTIIERIAQTTLPKCFVKLVIRIRRNNAHADFGCVIDKAGAQIFSLRRYDID